MFQHEPKWKFKSACGKCCNPFNNEDLTKVTTNLYLCKECLIEYEEEQSSILHTNPDSEDSAQP